VFTRSNEMFGVVTPSQIPISTQLATCLEIKARGGIRFGIDGEVGVPKIVGPDIVGVRNKDRRNLRGRDEVTRPVDDGISMER